MIGCVDVDYRPGPPETAVAACVVIPSWTAARPVAEYTCTISKVAPYVPGSFYERELPCLLAVLERVKETLEVVVVDGHVFLDTDGRKGLGAHLFDALGGEVAVVGVAKTRFGGAAGNGAAELLRGQSKRPLFVTARGMDTHLARDMAARMSGEFRLPTALERVDRLCRR